VLLTNGRSRSSEHLDGLNGSDTAAIGRVRAWGSISETRVDSVPTVSRIRRAQMWVSTFSMKLRVRVSRAAPKMVPGGPSSTTAPSSMNTTLSATL
jgi:hypothetical protein